ncbi:MAG: S8 family peptidase [Methanothrix sp.]|nr:S8 family peptidase [Methanothrix sp.]
MPGLPHLPLIELTSDLPRLNKRGFSDRVPRNANERKDFSKKAHDECDQIYADFKKLQEEYKGYIDPELIFRISLKGSVKPREIQRLGLKILSVLDKNAIIVFSSKKHFDDFFGKLGEYEEDSERRKHTFLDAFSDLEKVDSKTKIGPQLQKQEFRKNENAILDIEFWFLGDDRGSVKQMDKWALELKNVILNNKGQWITKFRTKSFYVLRAKLNKELYNKIINLPQVAFIDRPPRMQLPIRQIKEQRIDDLEIHEPSPDATGVLIFDSGIVPGHPLLSKAIGKAKSFIYGKSPVDENGHGTSVAGLSLYGDINQCIKNKTFNPDCWLFSARVLDEDNAYNNQELIEKIFLRSLNIFLRQYPLIRVINISVGTMDDVFGFGKRQFRWASLIDDKLHELSKINRELIIVISAGNNFPDHDYYDYPDNLFKDDAKLINPATSALAITVGSISPGLESSIDPSRRSVAGKLGFPSPFTRTGPGVDKMIKPDLVEIGGDYILPADEDPTIGIVTMNRNFVGGGLFTIDNGTSLSSAKISNLVAKLWNTFPSASSNLIKALIISSANIPKKSLPDKSGQIMLDKFCTLCCPPRIDEEKLNSVYGYGFPNFDEAKSSEINKVILLDESTIKLDSARFYEIPLPESYYSTDGDREISVTLCFDPETRRNRGDSYLGCIMQFKLHRGSSLGELKAKYTKVLEEDLDEVEDPKEMTLDPGMRIRSKGCNQKGSVVLKRPRFSDESLQLAIICINKWISDPDYEQKYSVVVRVIHENPVDIYSPIKARIEQRIRVRTHV